jgi:hypothetical protein
MERDRFRYLPATSPLLELLALLDLLDRDYFSRLPFLSCFS